MTATLSLLVMLFAGGPPADSARVHLGEASATASAFEADEILWLARCIYSESDRPHEQRLVAWVVRNRVETRFRGETYREVVLEDRQFSAFNDPTPRRARILALTPDDTQPSWQKALEIAREVYHARATERPFPVTTRHFYSPVSMKNRAVPHWAVAETPIPMAAAGIDPNRFQFFADIDQDGGPDVAQGSSIREQHHAVVNQMRRSRRIVRLSGPIPRPVPPAQPERIVR